MNLEEAIELYKNKNNTEEHIYNGLIDKEHFTEKVFGCLSRIVTNHVLEDNYLRVVIA